jgi:hypothetical protein
MRALPDYESSRHDKGRTLDQCGLTLWTAFIGSYLHPVMVGAVGYAADAARVAQRLVKRQVGRLGAQANTGRAWAWAR